MAKGGDRFVEDMIDRGRRELGGFLYPDSNIAQAMYPLRGNVEVEKGGVDEPGPSLAERLDEKQPPFRGPDRDDRDRGIERE